MESWSKEPGANYEKWEYQSRVPIHGWKIAKGLMFHNKLLEWSGELDSLEIPTTNSFLLHFWGTWIPKCLKCSEPTFWNRYYRGIRRVKVAYPASEGKNGTTPGIGPLLTTARGNQSQVTEGRKGRHNFWGGDPTTSPPAAFTLENSLGKKLGCPWMYKKICTKCKRARALLVNLSIVRMLSKAGKW